MEYIVVGLKRRSGDYEGSPFDNTYFNCIYDGDTSKGDLGSMVECFKVKTSTLDFTPSLNDVIIPVYNRFGKVETVRLR